MAAGSHRGVGTRARKMRIYVGQGSAVQCSTCEAARGGNLLERLRHIGGYKKKKRRIKEKRVRKRCANNIMADSACVHCTEYLATHCKMLDGVGT